MFRVANVEIQQGDLTSALEKLKAGQAIMERLAKSDPGNAGWQTDLSASYDRVSDALLAQGNLPEALTSYQASLAIRDRLAKSDPGNVEWQRGLSVCYARLAVAYRKAAQQVQAREALAAGRAIIAPVVAQFPDWSQLKKDLAWFDYQIAEQNSKRPFGSGSGQGKINRWKLSLAKFYKR
jgi:tetratricopeptide (TPR) repeat protein